MSANFEIARQVIVNATPTISPVETNLTVESLAIHNDGYISKPLIVETQISRQESTVRISNNTKKVKTKITSVAANDTSEYKARSFPYGYCTYYAAQRRFVPWGGNAITWLSGAQKFGFATGSVPQVGAIVVTSEGGSTGHVGIVDAVSGDQITISEMNFQGFGVISSRTISASYRAIMGYIY